tara:strand:+ start:251 stop:811 length:561 start_codon:yes stop_codon:yes gene_type:complete
MQTSKDFTEEIMNFPAAGFAVASFVNPDLPQPATTTNPIFTPDPSSPTPSSVESNSFEDNIFPIPIITPSPTEMPEQDFSPDNLLGIGTKDIYFPTLSPSNTPSPSLPPFILPNKDTFIDIVKKKDGELICFKVCTLIFALIIGCVVTYLIFFNGKSLPKPEVQEFRTSGFGSTFDSIIDDLILNN